MKNTFSPSALPIYLHHIDAAGIKPRIDALIAEIADAALSVDILVRALNGNLEEATAILRAVPTHEGRLLERGIGLIARCNPDLVVLTQNIRLPVSASAIELVRKNEAELLRSLTLDADASGRKTYAPDLIIVNRRSRIAHVVDVKRSLNSFDIARMTDLKQRMLAASLVVPDMLYKDHHRLIVNEVRVVILNAENQRTDIDNGVWPLTHLDHLLELGGAGEIVSAMRQTFMHRINVSWSAARESLTSAVNRCKDVDHPDTKVGPIALAELPAAMREVRLDDGGLAHQPAPASTRFGFARSPDSRPH